MLLATAKQMRAIEEEAITDARTSLYDLMERAGKAVAEEAASMAPEGGRVTIFCGKGNNGGDGFVAARHLAASGNQVEVVMLISPTELKGAAETAYQKIAGEESIKMTPFSARRRFRDPGLVIDAIFGFGLKGAVRGPAERAVRVVNSLDAPVLSVDIPSGIDSDTGQISGEAVKAARTVTFTAPKAGMAVHPGCANVGEVRVADIGIDKATVVRHAKICLGSRALARPLLPSRRVDAHKGDCGRVLIIAGSVGMTGAAVMCADAAQKIGAGLVTLGAPESLNDILEVKLTEVMTKPLPETSERTIRDRALDTIMEIVPDMDAVAIGPGLSTHPSTVALIKQLILTVETPLVVDADALTGLAGSAGLLKKRPGPTVLTPHAGELGRLIGCSAAEVQADRLAVAARAASDWDVTVILKGARTIVAGTDCLYINPTGNPGMATAGTGDILAGILVGLMAQGLPPYPAGVLATYLHGRAGDIGAEAVTELALRATDLLDYLPTAIRELQGGNRRGDELA